MDIKLTHSLLKDYLDTKAKPADIAKALSLCGPTVDRFHTDKTDTVYDIEIITNRVDSASAFGVAREAAAILPQFDLPALLKNDPYQLSLSDLGDLPKEQPINVQILDHSLVPHFTAIALEVTLKPSPPSTQKLLTALDQRPINNLVDITNELTARFGQPTHIFDLDKIKGGKMILRSSKKGEKITTLDDRTHTLRGGDIVIEDGEGRLIDLCGVMGGGLSCVDENTKRVLLFVQTYEPKAIRRTSLYTQERTLASQLFEKSTDPQLVLPTLIAGVKLLQERADGKIISSLIDLYPNPPQTKTLTLDLNWLSRFLGIEIKPKQITQILTTLGFEIKLKEDLAQVTVPSWRLNDISIPEDLAEEISRVYGYYRLPSILPPTTIPDTQTDPLLKYEGSARHYLADLGFTEIYNLALISAELCTQAQIDPGQVKVSNPLSSDYQYMRPSLIPSLLYDLQQNQGKALPPLRLFELANIYVPQDGQTLPAEISNLTLATQGLDFLTTKGYLQALLTHLKVEGVSFAPTNLDLSPLISSQSATILYQGEVIGAIGPLSPQVKLNFSLTGEVVLADLNFSKLASAINPIYNFHPISSYPPVLEDITLTSSQKVGDLLEKLKSAHPLLTEVTYLTSYQNKHSFRLEFTDYSKPLTQADITPLKDKLLTDLSD